MWRVSNDRAWHKVALGCYRHYSGVSVIRKGKLWYAVNRGGDVTSNHRNSRDAVIGLAKEGLWKLEQFDAFTRTWGESLHTVSPVRRDEPVFFVSWAPHEREFPSFVTTILAKHFFGQARCARCSNRHGCIPDQPRFTLRWPRESEAELHGL